MKSTLLIALTCFGCGGDSKDTSLECADGIESMLANGQRITVESPSAKALRGASVTAPQVAPTRSLSIRCGDTTILPTGYVPMSPVVQFETDNNEATTRPFHVAIPIKLDRLPSGTQKRHLRVYAARRNETGAVSAHFAPVSSVWVDETSPDYTVVRFDDTQLASEYQIAISEVAGESTDRTFQYRAMIGISMGGDAALNLGLKHHDKFDFVASLGGEPGPAKRYAMTSLFNNLFGGFCSAADQAAGRGNIGELCPANDDPGLVGQYAFSTDFEHLLYQEGSGVGLTLDRKLYMKAGRDLSRAYGNPAYYNRNDPFVPPGVAPTSIYAPLTDQCNNPTVLSDFFDQEFNPMGTHPVITVCDGGNFSGSRSGEFNPNASQTIPWQILLAVDLNGNNQRDSGEPIILSAYEPFDDIGEDGVPNELEDGYDPTTNPDPSFDDYHYLHNPSGTEGNYRFDTGEPYDDSGLDGVMGTCQQGETPPMGVAGCYDWGEGDGQWSLSPTLRSWFETGLYDRFSAIPEQKRSSINVWLDAGIRDFLNANVSANIGISQLQTDFDQPVGVFNGFHGLTGATDEQLYDFSEIDWDRIPKNVHIRYGDPDASPDEINAGDGRHVGSATQVIQRFASAFAWVSHHWPNGDRNPDVPQGQLIEGLSFTSSTTGRDTPFGLFLPPGYDHPDYADATYPVIYFFHGYGQDPNDLVSASAIFENYMVTPNWTEEQRFQKFIIVYVDGRCRPEDTIPVSGGDECERGTFYLDSPRDTTSKMETHLLELLEHIDSNYRTKQPETVSVPS